MIDNTASQPDSQTLLNQVVLEYLSEQKRKRRWRWVIRIIILIILGLIILNVFFSSSEPFQNKDQPHIGVIDIQGGIFEQGTGSSADDLVKGLSDAYKSKGLKAVVLRINSPGGSPVQADYMYNTVRFYRKHYPDVKIYAVCVDICASAAYYVAASADEIYANPASMVGSIGVIYNGFGLVDLIQKLGVSRRIQTAGANKGFLDPFSPEKPEDKAYLQTMLNEVHQQFIKQVKQGRGDRLKIDNLTFSGLFWTGEQAKVRGLIDGFASTGELARKIHAKGTTIDYTYHENLFDRMSKNIGAAVANQLPEALGLKPKVSMSLR